MASPLPYLASNRNVETLFSKIQSAKVPDKFTHSFLQTTLGLKNTNDRGFIPLLRALGFIDQSGTPTSTYRLLKSKDTAKVALGQAVKIAYAPLFEADEKAHTHSGDKLKGLVAQVSGSDDDMTSRITGTFNALVRAADFSLPSPMVSDPEDAENEDSGNTQREVASTKIGRSLRPEFHYNIQIHLPSNATEDVYLNIFNALRKTFQ
ncbi:DUF5343 domain-containing protein [Pseudoxanthomonas sp. 22568]|uniref:DUF5343 domain-containing protein n=1 Tax=Pseudoxanthomonas sp. 22568 TaxID=3453945 RepID=UPI003F84F27C